MSSLQELFLQSQKNTPQSQTPTSVPKPKESITVTPLEKLEKWFSDATNAIIYEEGLLKERISDIFTYYSVSGEPRSTFIIESYPFSEMQMYSFHSNNECVYPECLVQWRDVTELIQQNPSLFSHSIKIPKHKLNNCRIELEVIQIVESHNGFLASMLASEKVKNVGYRIKLIIEQKSGFCDIL